MNSIKNEGEKDRSGLIGFLICQTLTRELDDEMFDAKGASATFFLILKNVDHSKMYEEMRRGDAQLIYEKTFSKKKLDDDEEVAFY